MRARVMGASAVWLERWLKASGRSALEKSLLARSGRCMMGSPYTPIAPHGALWRREAGLAVNTRK